MIVFFGDHQPPLGNDFYEKLYGKKLDDRTTEEVFQQYEVPFFIWANYDIPEQDGVTISSNMLSTLTMKLPGLVGIAISVGCGVLFAAIFQGMSLCIWHTGAASRPSRRWANTCG